MNKFIVIYAGMPLVMPQLTAVERTRATQFDTEADAWYSAGASGLSYSQIRVEPYLEQTDTQLNAA